MKKMLNNKKILIIIGSLLGIIVLLIVGHFVYRYYTDLKRDKYTDEHEKKDNLGIAECKYFNKDEDKILSCTIKNTITNFDFFRLSFDVQTSDDVEYIDYDVFSDEWYISINNSNKNSMKVYTSIDYNFVQGNLKNDIPEYITLNFKINNITKDSVMIFKNLEFLDNDSILHKNENDIIINLIDYTKNNNNEENNINDKEENDADIGELKTKTYKISSDNLYIEKYEKQYTEYSRLTELTEEIGINYYINDGNLFIKENGNVSQANINGEKAKYLAIGSDCGGLSVLALTTSGNVYEKNYMDKSSFTIVYSGGDAEEILILNESKIFTTCGEKTIYILKNNQLYSLHDNGTRTRQDTSPFSIAFYHNDKSILLYPDGTINNYMYCSKPMCAAYVDDIKNEFVTDENGNKILVSFVFSMDNINYIIDTNGSIYKINVPATNEIKKMIKFDMVKINNTDIGNIDYVEVSSYTKKQTYRYKEYEESFDIEKLTMYDQNGNTITYTSENTNSLKYIDYLYH